MGVDKGDDEVGGSRREVPVAFCTKRDVVVADVTVDARTVEGLDAMVGGIKVEPVDTDVRLRLLDAERMSWDREVPVVTVEARARGALGYREVSGAMITVAVAGEQFFGCGFSEEDE